MLKDFGLSGIQNNSSKLFFIYLLLASFFPRLLVSPLQCRTYVQFKVLKFSTC